MPNMEGSGYSFSRSGVAYGSRGGTPPLARKKNVLTRSGGLFGHLIERQPAAIEDADVAQLHVLDIVPRNAADDRPVARIGIVHHHVGDAHAADGADGRAFGRAHAAAEADEDRRVRNLAHGDVGDGDVFDVRAVHGLQRQPARAVEDDVGDGDVAEIAFAIRCRS